MSKRHYIITHRKKWALTQTELGKLLGLARCSVSSYERHLTLPSFNMALRLEIIFGKTAGYLFPVLYEENEEEVMRAAAAIYASLEGKTDRTSERKRDLLEAMMKRASLTANA